MNAKKELDRISKEFVKLESLMQKTEEDGVYDGSIYDEIDKLEARRQELEQIVEAAE